MKTLLEAWDRRAASVPTVEAGQEIRRCADELEAALKQQLAAQVWEFLVHATDGIEALAEYGRQGYHIAAVVYVGSGRTVVYLQRRVGE